MPAPTVGIDRGIVFFQLSVQLSVVSHPSLFSIHLLSVVHPLTSVLLGMIFLLSGGISTKLATNIQYMCGKH